jgi:hypothetical protein
MLALREAMCLVALYTEGAAIEAIACVMQRDVRTVRKILRQAGAVLRQDTPLPTDWWTGIPPAARATLQTYFTDLGQRQQAAWHQVEQQAVTVTADTYVLHTPTAYAAVWHTAQPSETLPALARRLGLDLTAVLLAYVAWRDTQETHHP